MGLNIAGLPSHESSHSFWFVHAKTAVKVVHGYDTDGIWSREKASNSLLSRNLTSGKGTESTNIKTKKSKKAKITPVKSTSKGIQRNQKSHSKYIYI